MTAPRTTVGVPMSCRSTTSARATAPTGCTRWAKRIKTARDGCPGLSTKAAYVVCLSHAAAGTALRPASPTVAPARPQSTATARMIGFIMVPSF
jgi:hypothetical protein